MKNQFSSSLSLSLSYGSYSSGSYYRVPGIGEGEGLGDKRPTA